MKIKYISNNSGGSWWLDDDDWRSLEGAGWHVEWGGPYFCHSDLKNPPHISSNKPPGKPEPCASHDECPGHRRYDSADEAGRWLGGLARGCWKECETPGEAMAEFERITGQSVTDEGCNCCGPPHEFSWDGGYASGEECAEYMDGRICKECGQAI